MLIIDRTFFWRRGAAMVVGLVVYGETISQPNCY